MTAVALMTAEELLRLQPPHTRSELVDGVMRVREPAGFRHGEIALEMALLIGTHVIEFVESGKTTRQNEVWRRVP